MSWIDAAGAARIAAALVALETELATTGIPVAYRGTVVIELLARRRDERFWRERAAKGLASRDTVAQSRHDPLTGSSGWSR